MLTAGLSAVEGQVNTLYKLADAAAPNPIVFVDSFKTEMRYFIVNPQMIESVEVYRDSIAIRKFGEIGKHGVIIITPKAHANLHYCNCELITT